MKRGPVLLALLLFVPPAIFAQDLPYLRSKPRPNGPYQIRGKMVNAQTGQPIPGVEIQIYESAQNIGEMFEMTESAADGSFHFDGLAQGKYSLMASRRGYAPQYYLQHENFWTGIAVGPGNDALQLRFPLTPSATISGKVTDENGEGIRQATVKLWSESLQNGVRKSSPGNQTTTDDEGKYRFDHLTDGRYTVSVAASPWYRRFLNAAPPNENEDSEGPTAEKATADVKGPETAERKKAGSPENSLPDLVYSTTFYPTGRQVREATWFQLRPGDEQTADFQLIPTPGFRVRIKTALAEEGGFSQVRVLPESEDASWEAAATPQRRISPGVVEVSGLASGNYRVVLIGRGAGGLHEETLQVNGDAELDFQGGVPRGLVISGTLRFAQPPTTSAWVALQMRDEAGNPSVVQTMPIREETPPGSVAKQPNEFAFQFANLPPGARTFQLSATAPQGIAIEKIEATGARIDGNKVTPDGTGEVHLKLTVSENTAVIRGAATKHGQPFAGAMILLLPENGQPESARRDQSDSDGTFTLSNIVPGKYRLMALVNGWDLPWADAEQQKALLAKGVPVVIGKDSPAPFKIEVE
ncbi:MAG TPA: carboxypeptidase-like regulatory domain-containing protein [Candidatus Limnocylindrales bacterium]|nr:carboxypeptidase-like regulatory domain-containing protein [Candidatus Limnocylindrales bacterium]